MYFLGIIYFLVKYIIKSILALFLHYLHKIYFYSISIISNRCLNDIGAGQATAGLERLLRIHFLQRRLNLSDSAIEEAPYVDSGFTPCGYCRRRYGVYPQAVLGDPINGEKTKPGCFSLPTGKTVGDTWDQVVGSGKTLTITIVEGR